MNPLFTPDQKNTASTIRQGDICVSKSAQSSLGLYLVTAQQNNEFECYELVADGQDNEQLFKLSTPLFDEAFICLDLGKTHYLGETDIKSVQGHLEEAALELVLRALVQRQVSRYGELKYQTKTFVPEQSAVPVSGKVLGTEELHHLVDASLDAWLTTGRFNAQFEKKLADFIGVKHVLTVNSGSSANLLALTALTSPKLGERSLKPGDEVVTVAAGFPTTVNPILQNGLVPVFVDISLPSYNIDVSQLEAALSDKTKAIMMAHTLGNAFNLDEVVSFARKHKLWLIEDCCDALGTMYTPSQDLAPEMPVGEPRHVGTFGDIATLSFYPAHHITMGEGGAVFTNNGQLKLLLESFRDWGRDCFCEPGKDNTCKKRFSYQLGQLPCGYDHKYTYSHLGYNLKITDMQAAVAVAQMERLPGFIAKRKQNFRRLHEGLKNLTDFLTSPEAEPQVDASWFGFALTLKQGERADFIQHLEKHKIASRLVFGGNLVKQPYFENQTYRVVGELKVTDEVMNKSLWIGVFPGLDEQMIDYMIDVIQSYFDVNKA